MVDSVTGIDLEKAGIADIVNQRNVGTSQRFRNEQIRKQTQEGTSPDLSSLYSTQQPTQYEFPNTTPKVFPTQEQDTFWFPANNETRYSPGFSTTDPYVKQLNSLYSYNMPDLQPNAFAEGGAGWDFTKNPLGSWNIGKNLVLAPKEKLSGTPGMTSNGEASNAYTLDPYAYLGLNPDGSFNPEGWEIRSTKSNAGQAIMGTLGILAAPVLSYYEMAGADAASMGSGGTMGTENMFFGGTNAIAPTATQSGIFGQKSLDLGNTYANKAAEGALKGFLTSGGDPMSAVQGGILGPVSSYISDTSLPYVGNIASKALGGAASGSLASLFTKNDPIAGSLFGGMSGGLHAYLNSVNANADPFNKTLSNTISGLARKKLFRNI